MRYQRILLFLVCAALAHAAAFTGTLDPASNPNLTTWDQYLPGYVAPIAGPTDYEMSWNIAVHTFNVASAGPVTIQSLGYGLGGFDAVVSIFAGSGNAATYVGHGYNPVAPGDFTMSINLAVGLHTLTVSVFANEPCASGPCYGAGTFGDGFTNLVNYDPSGTLEYMVTVESGGQPEVPEPAVGLAIPVVVAFMAARARWTRRRAG